MARRRLNLRANSRARKSVLYYKGDYEWFGQPEYAEFPISEDDTYITVTKTTKIDGLAAQTYDDPELWYVIALANDIELWPSDVKVGQTLRLPSRRRVESILKAGRRIQ